MSTWSRAITCVLLVACIATMGLTACASAQSLRGRVRLEHIADVEEPTALAIRAGDDSLYVTEQAGRVVAVDPGGNVTTFLDLSKQITAGGEQGLLGLAFSPDGSKLYVHFTHRSGNTRVEEYTIVNGAIAPEARRRILAVHQPDANHNGGQLAFGPDGMLYLGLGDGGGADDEGSGHADGGNGQTLDTLLGKILRVDPTPTDDKPYTIPSDNPFAPGGSQPGGGRPEIWAFGLRNPWRFSFDRETGDLWIGDVGQNEWEEVDYAAAAQEAGKGANYGWNVFEADEQFRDGDTTGPALPPLFALSHENGECSVIGGYVYRGTSIPKLEGAYVYSDYCNGRLRYVRQVDNEVTEMGSLSVRLREISSFGQDADGELYVLSQSSGLYRIDPA
ncbi:MAG: sugar dehydrogenase [Acidimicrobiia bacterium]|nr:sugar dehydrogenase [Acidimicrobiia bacterium]